MPSTVERDNTTSRARVADDGIVLMEVHTINVGSLSATVVVVGIANTATKHKKMK